MPRYGYRRRMRRSGGRRQSATMHVPSTMEQSLAPDILSLIFAQTPSLDAGASASSNIEASDRDRTVNVGNSIGKVTFDIDIRNAAASGSMEFAVIRCERCFGVPIVGTDPIPSSLDVTGEGIQQAFRTRMPGRVLHFSQMAVTIETTRTKKIIVNPAKFRMSKVRPGDYLALAVFNRNGASITYSVQMRYKEFQ